MFSGMLGSPTKAIQLVKPVAGGQLVARTQALEELRSLGPDAKIHALAIVGVARQGKSTLLELLAGMKNAFKTADGTKPCTEGIHMLVVPFKNDANTYLLLLDSEGIESSGQSEQYKAQLFSMCTMFSSMFVFNHKGVLNLRAFKELSLAATILEDIISDASRSQDTHSLTTQLLVVLRDFDKEQLLGKTPNDHLEEWLVDTPGAPKDSVVSADNAVRASIKQLFRKRNCLTMARPGRKTTSVTDNALSPEFMDDLDEVKTFVNQNIQAMKVNDTTIGGPEFADLVQTSVQLVNDGTPLLVTRLGSLARDFNARLVKLCMGLYVDRKEEMGMADDLRMLARQHEDAKNAAMQQLEASLRGDSEAQLHAKGTLEGQLKTLHEQTVPGFIIGYNARLKQRCLTQYQTDMGDFSELQSMQEFELRHTMARLGGRELLMTKYEGTAEEKSAALQWFDRHVSDIKLRQASSMETIIRDRNSGGSLVNLVGAGGVASGATLMATLHPFFGTIIGIGGAFTLLVANVPFLKKLFWRRTAATQ